jgi:Flp pilus assembly pilin Flp
MKKTHNKFSKLVKDNRGATMVEYGLMLALILVLGYVGFTQLGGKVKQAGTDTTSAFGAH